MTSTGIRNRRTTDDRADDVTKQVEDSYIRKAKGHTDQARAESGNAGPAAIGGPSIPGASYLPISGKYGMIGSMSYNPTLVIIDDGRINVTPNQSGASKDSSYILVTGQGSPDDLRFIDGATKNGQIIKLQGTATQIINLKAATIAGIDSISGLITVTVVTTSNHNLTTNDKVNILATTNFNINNVEVIVVNPTTFTYPGVGNITPESAGFVQNGNIVTADGNDIVLDSTQALNGVPIIPLIFDPTVAGNGAWRPTQLVSVSGGSGITFPIDFPEDDRGAVGASTQDILFTDADRHSVKMTVSGDVDLSFSSPPSNETAYTNIIIVQDGTGGHTVTVPVGTINKDIVDAGILTGPDEETGIVIKYAFGVFYAFLETGNIVTGGSSFSGNLSDLVINVTKDWQQFGITNLSATAYVDTGGVSRGSISGDAGAAALRLSLVSGGKFLISDVLTDIVSFDDATGLKIEGSHVINMNNNIINTIRELQFDNSNGHTPSNENTIAFDNVDDELKYAVALTTDAHSWYANTDRLASIVRTGTDQGQLNIHDIISDILQVNNQFIMSDSSLDPGFNGEFRRNSADVKVFSGGAVRNLSNVGASPSSIVDGNTSATVFDAGPTFAVVLNGIQKFTVTNNRVDYEELDLFGVTQINMNDSGANLISSLSASVSGLLLNILSTSDVYDIKFNSVDAFHVDDLRTRILSTTPNTTPPVLSLFRDDPSPTIGDELGVIKFEGNNSTSAFTTYGEVSMTIESLTNNAEYANYIVNIKQNGFDVDMLRIVNGVMILRTFNSVSNEGALFNLVKEDASPGNGNLIAKVSYNILDSPIETTYSQTRAEIEDATDAGRYFISTRADGDLRDVISIVGRAGTPKADITFLDQTILKAASGGFLGLFVTDEPGALDSIGDSGTLQMPVNNLNPTSLNDLNVEFGDFDGAHGYDSSIGDKLWVRVNSSLWVGFVPDSTITS